MCLRAFLRVHYPFVATFTAFATLIMDIDTAAAAIATDATTCIVSIPTRGEQLDDLTNRYVPRNTGGTVFPDVAHDNKAPLANSRAMMIPDFRNIHTAVDEREAVGTIAYPTMYACYLRSLLEYEGETPDVYWSAGSDPAAVVERAATEVKRVLDSVFHSIESSDLSFDPASEDVDCSQVLSLLTSRLYPSMNGNVGVQDYDLISDVYINNVLLLDVVTRKVFERYQSTPGAIHNHPAIKLAMQRVSFLKLVFGALGAHMNTAAVMHSVISTYLANKKGGNEWMVISSGFLEMNPSCGFRSYRMPMPNQTDQYMAFANTCFVEALVLHPMYHNGVTCFYQACKKLWVAQRIGSSAPERIVDEDEAQRIRSSYPQLQTVSLVPFTLPVRLTGNEPGASARFQPRKIDEFVVNTVTEGILRTRTGSKSSMFFSVKEVTGAARNLQRFAAMAAQVSTAFWRNMVHHHTMFGAISFANGVVAQVSEGDDRVCFKDWLYNRSDSQTPAVVYHDKFFRTIKSMEFDPALRSYGFFEDNVLPRLSVNPAVSLDELMDRLQFYPRFNLLWLDELIESSKPTVVAAATATATASTGDVYMSTFSPVDDAGDGDDLLFGDGGMSMFVMPPDDDTRHEGGGDDEEEDDGLVSVCATVCMLRSLCAKVDVSQRLSRVRGVFELLLLDDVAWIFSHKTNVENVKGDKWNKLRARYNNGIKQGAASERDPSCSMTWWGAARTISTYYRLISDRLEPFTRLPPTQVSDELAMCLVESRDPATVLGAAKQCMCKSVNDNLLVFKIRAISRLPTVLSSSASMTADSSMHWCTAQIIQLLEEDHYLNARLEEYEDYVTSESYRRFSACYRMSDYMSFEDKCIDTIFSHQFRPPRKAKQAEPVPSTATTAAAATPVANLDGQATNNTDEDASLPDICFARDDVEYDLVRRMLYGLLGRVFFPTRYDGMVYFPYLYGLPGTGKSVLVSIISNLLGRHNVGDVNASYVKASGGFALGQIAVGKLAVICTEYFPAMCKVIHASVLKGFLDPNDQVSVNIKYSAEASVVHTNKFLACGNYPFNMSSDSGGGGGGGRNSNNAPDDGESTFSEFARRIVYFVFMTPVSSATRMNTSVDRNIAENKDLVLAKLICSYQYLRHLIGPIFHLNEMPSIYMADYHRRAVSYADRSESPLASFLGDSNYVIKHPSARVPLEVVYDMYAYYLRNKFTNNTSVRMAYLDKFEKQKLGDFERMLVQAHDMSVQQSSSSGNAPTMIERMGMANSSSSSTTTTAASVAKANEVYPVYINTQELERTAFIKARQTVDKYVVYIDINPCLFWEVYLSNREVVRAGTVYNGSNGGGGDDQHHRPHPGFVKDMYTFNADVSCASSSMHETTLLVVHKFGVTFDVNNQHHTAVTTARPGELHFGDVITTYAHRVLYEHPVYQANRVHLTRVPGLSDYIHDRIINMQQQEEEKNKNLADASTTTMAGAAASVGSSTGQAQPQQRRVIRKTRKRLPLHQAIDSTASITDQRSLMDMMLANTSKVVDDDVARGLQAKKQRRLQQNITEQKEQDTRVQTALEQLNITYKRLASEYATLKRVGGRLLSSKDKLVHTPESNPFAGLISDYQAWRLEASEYIEEVKHRAEQAQARADPTTADHIKHTSDAIKSRISDVSQMVDNLRAIRAKAVDCSWGV
jgi:Family of unknown function (DUF5906)